MTSEMKPETLYETIREETQQVLIGTEDTLKGLVVSLLARGNVLLEGVPGVAKTTAARVFARTMGVEYSRIQMTPDLLPADIIGTEIYREATGEFDTRLGPVFANVVLADEINRASPKTQSALLEAMEERTVTIGGETFSLPDPFILIATQNPIEMQGTFELPEAQRDRFLLKLTVDLPDDEDELAILDRFDRSPGLDASDVRTVVSHADVSMARDVVDDVHVSDPVKSYILRLVTGLREHPEVDHGPSPRASLAVLRTSKAYASIQGRSYVIPDDVDWLAEPVFRHRLVLDTSGRFRDISSEQIINEVLNDTVPPNATGEYEEDPA